MPHVAAGKVGALFLFLALAVPGLSRATLMEFGAAGGGANLSDINEIPEADSTALTLLFATAETLQIMDYDPSANPKTALGSGETTCNPSFLPSSSCSTTGGDSSNGEVGTGIAMFSVTVAGGSIGDQLLWVGDFTASDFEAIQANQVIATVVPEPGTSLLMGLGLGGLALVGRKRSA